MKNSFRTTENKVKKAPTEKEKWGGCAMQNFFLLRKFSSR